MTLDRLEGELVTTLRAIGGREVAFERLLDATAAKGLSLRRLPRDVTKAALERRLAQLYELLAAQRPGLLDCSPDDLATLG